MATKRRSASGAATRAAASSRTTRPRSPRAWSCSTPSTRSRPSRRNDLAVRWNCKAGKCGSCSAEINGMPRLMCMTRLNELPLDEPVTVEPMQAFPRSRTWSPTCRGTSGSRRRSSRSSRGRPTRPTAPGAWQQADVDRVQEFRKCIECFLCQDVCHVLRDHHKHEEFIGPRFLVYVAALEMHPLDTEDRARRSCKEAHGIGYCNITKCCTQGLPRAHHDHRQRDHPAQGARRGPVLRSRAAAVPRVRGAA